MFNLFGFHYVSKAELKQELEELTALNRYLSEKAGQTSTQYIQTQVFLEDAIEDNDKLKVEIESLKDQVRVLESEVYRLEMDIKAELNTNDYCNIRITELEKEVQTLKKSGDISPYVEREVNALRKPLRDLYLQIREFNDVLNHQTSVKGVLE